MSVFGVSIFQDRDAMDLFEEILNGGDLIGEIRTSCSIVIDDFEDLTMYETCCVAVLGAELVAASMGNISKHFPGPEFFDGEYTDGVKVAHPDWDEIADPSNKDLRLLAINAIKTLMTSERCDYYLFWRDAKLFEEWEAEMNDLLDRLH